MSSLAARRKQRDYRRRLRKGRAVLKLEVLLDPVIEALLAAGRLSPEAALQRSEVERAAAVVLGEWCERWREVC